MAIRSLPRRPSLEHLRNEARELQRLVREADPAALSRTREFHPRFGERADAFRLSDAQLTVARSYGHPSWPRLKTYVEAITAYTREPHAVTPRPDATDEFLRLACLVYGGDDLSRPALAGQMLRGDPALAGRSIHTAAAVGDAVAAARLLATDPSLATATGGPFGWEPLLYVAYSRLVSDDHRHSHVAVARLLLEHGADPNDDQTIYNRHFLPDNDYLKLLLAHGLGTARRGPWPSRLGEHLTPPPLLLEDALVFVADDDRYADRVALLLGCGVDPGGRGTRHPALRGLRPIERARIGGAQKILGLLLDAGAQLPATDAVDTVLGLCMRGERETVEGQLADDPGLAAAAGWAPHAHHDELVAWLHRREERLPG